MQRPDFRESTQLIRELEGYLADLRSIFDGTRMLEERARDLCGTKMMAYAAEALAGIPVEELKNSKAGIRTAALEEAGYRSLNDLYRVTDAELCAVPGIGEKQTAVIRSIIDEFLNNLAQHARFSLTSEDGKVTDPGLICAFTRFRRAEAVAKDAELVFGEAEVFLPDTIASVKIRSMARWVFSFFATKEETVVALNLLRDYRESEKYRAGEDAIIRYRNAEGISEAEALAAFEQNPAAYYALLERLTGAAVQETLIYSSIPETMAAEISRQELNLNGFQGDLRAYQRFGAQYILHQGRVLLGDEMGLGKTVQAIASMAHLHENDPTSRFLVVCPASVLVNWCREIRKFSVIPVHLLHGTSLENAFASWLDEGGVAVTNYESMGRIVDRIDNHLHLSLLVIDEAHYIKNPSAQRTKHIRRLDDESERILMMTGTPLENKVDEMCELLAFIRPDMVENVREQAAMRHLDTFKEMLSPVYLRRQADQVLAELPPLIENEEWCEMTPGDRIYYAAAIAGRNFMAMRRVSFLQEDLKTSSKAQRLLELCSEARSEGRKIVIFSYFRETVRKTLELLRAEYAGPGDRGASGVSGDRVFIAEINGSIAAAERQTLIDRFHDSEPGSVLVCQIQAGGTGLNIQTASVVIFCEPQIKPSLERQAISRVYRMGQIRNVLAFRLLCENTVDEAIVEILKTKQFEFDSFADESAAADAADMLSEKEWISSVIEAEKEKWGSE